MALGSSMPSLCGEGRPGWPGASSSQSQSPRGTRVGWGSTAGKLAPLSFLALAQPLPSCVTLPK